MGVGSGGWKAVWLRWGASCLPWAASKGRCPCGADKHGVSSVRLEMSVSMVW